MDAVRLARRLVIGVVNEERRSRAVSVAVSRNDGWFGDEGLWDRMESVTEEGSVGVRVGGDGLKASVCGSVIGDGD